MNYGKYQAKKTFYNGVEFKSNLEARVAERFDELGIEWQYEPHCFRDKIFEGGQYTPDFYLPQADCYVEVAGVWDERHMCNHHFFREAHDKFHMEADYRIYDHISLLGIEGDGSFICDVFLCQCNKCGKWWAQDMCGGWHCEHCGYGDGDHTFNQVVSNIFD